MPAVAIFTLVLAALLVAALAFYLIWVVLVLRLVVDTLGKITFGVRAIAHRTEPIDPVMSDVNANLHAVARALENLVDKASAVTPPVKAS